ncbi:uncharacterized protein LOC141825233 [Curcuma longa]|uniref:uncharacterized protein LOC141825233 n=1 Tax=Curcuma longa TaxID=136217 RepID=UPI003D9E1275
MDESWRASIGSMIPRRRSTEETRGRRDRWADSGSGAALGPDDFRDVFGGPPRTVLLHRFSGELHAPGDLKTGNFYDEPFRPADLQRRIPRPAADGRGIQGFTSRARARMVKTEEGFYDDIFGSDSIGDRWSRSKSKSSSSVLSSEDVGPPIWAASSMVAEDAILSSFTSKLRPITIPSKRYVSSPSTTAREERGIDVYPMNSYFLECKDYKNKGHNSSELLRQRSHLGFSCCFSPPETISLETSFRRNHDEQAGSYNSYADSPSSEISSAFLVPMLSQADTEMEDVILELEGDRQGAGYKIEINDHGMGDREGSDAIDEAIAWAKQKFWDHQVTQGDEKLDSMNQIKEDPVGIC